MATITQYVNVKVTRREQAMINEMLVACLSPLTKPLAERLEYLLTTKTVKRLQEKGALKIDMRNRPWTQWND